jgi:hypothetical protein
MLPADGRDSTREVFFRAWHHHRDDQALEGVERVLVAVALRHPEYHALLEDPQRHLERDYSPLLGETNPFLHMGLHVAIEEQLALDEPRGIRDIYSKMLARQPDEHATQHLIMECLGEWLWKAQRQGAGLDSDSAPYLDCLARLTNAKP